MQAADVVADSDGVGGDFGGGRVTDGPHNVVETDAVCDHDRKILPVLKTCAGEMRGGQIDGGARVGPAAGIGNSLNGRFRSGSALSNGIGQSQAERRRVGIADEPDSSLRRSDCKLETRDGVESGGEAARRDAAASVEDVDDVDVRAGRRRRSAETTMSDISTSGIADFDFIG